MRFPDYPFASHHCSTACGAALHYLDEGPREAPAVLMLHGNPSWSFYYRHVISGLRDQFRCLVPDHLGMGLSDTPAASTYDYRLASRIADLDALIEQAQMPERFDLIVHDWGGMIGFAWAHCHPQRIRRLVVLNTAAFPLPNSAHLPWQLRLSRSFLGPLLIQGGNGFCRYALRHCVTRRALPPAVRAAYLAPYDSWHARLPVLRFVQDIPLAAGEPGWDVITSVADGLAQFRDRPLLICWGLQDFVFDHHFLAEWEQRFPAADIHRFADCGHYLLEEAHEEIVPLIRRHLTQEEPALSDTRTQQSPG